MSLVSRALLVWVGLVMVAMLNGGLRELLLIPRFGQSGGHVLSTLALCGAILGATWFTLPWLHPTSPAAAWRVGALWLALTLAFEFLAGRFVFGHPWSTLVADYNLARGRIWILVPVATLLGPRLVLRLRAA